MLKSQQPAVIPKIARYPSKRSYHFQPNPKSKCWNDLPGNLKTPIWPHWLLLKASSFSWELGQLSHDSCHSFSWELGQDDSCHSFFLTVGTAFFRTVVTADPATITDFFHIWLKPKPTIGTTFLLLKYLPFMLLFPQQLLLETAKIP